MVWLRKKGHDVGPGDSRRIWIVWVTGPHQWWQVYEICASKAAALECVEKSLKEDKSYDGVEIRGYTESGKPAVCRRVRS